MLTVSRDGLVHVAEARALYAALWDHADADELRAALPTDAFAGRAASVWALIEHHDSSTDPWPTCRYRAAITWSGPGRLMSILDATVRLDVARDAARLSGHAATLRTARRVGLNEHALMLAAVAPADGWPLTLADACRVLRLAPVYRDTADVLAQFDAIAHDVSTPPDEGRRVETRIGAVA